MLFAESEVTRDQENHFNKVMLWMRQYRDVASPAMTLIVPQSVFGIKRLLGTPVPFLC